MRCAALCFTQNANVSEAEAGSGGVSETGRGDRAALRRSPAEPASGAVWVAPARRETALEMQARLEPQGLGRRGAPSTICRPAAQVLELLVTL